MEIEETMEGEEIMEIQEKYTTIGVIKDHVLCHYADTKMRISFDRALRELSAKEALSGQPKPINVKNHERISDSEFKRFILDLPVPIKNIVANLKKSAIYEEISIPFLKDVFVFSHLPYVDDHIHEHDFFEMNYVYSGHCRQIVAGEERTLSEGAVAIIVPFTIHNVLVDDAESLILSVMVRKSTFDLIFGNLLTQNDLLASFFKNTLYEKQQNNYLLFQTENEEEIKKIIQTIVIEANNEEKYANLYCNCTVQLLFYTLLRLYSGTILYYAVTEKSMGQCDFSLILAYVQSNYKSITLPALADFFNYSQGHLCKLFKKNMKQKFSLVVQNLKIQKAKEYLSDTNLSIAAIAEKVGYDSVDYFTKVFKKYNGCTPTEYRRKISERALVSLTDGDAK